MPTYAYRTFAFTPCPELTTQRPVRHPVIIIGAGPTGLTAAADLAQRGIPVVVIDSKTQVSEGSRAICFAKRSLEIFDRLGVVAPMRAKGVTWNTGRLFFREREVYHFNLLPEDGHAHPAFINLQQYYVEQYLVEGLEAQAHVELRWGQRITAVEPQADHVRLTVSTPAGEYVTEAEWVIAADGARSPTRQMLGLDYTGVVFEEKFLIADVLMKADFPPERWFWFSPPFSVGQSALLHMQPDNIWRIDMQLGRDADEARERQPEQVRARIRAMLGPDVDFELEWVSIYRFHSRRMARFVHGRVLFAGDAAHIMSPFGARGANSGIQDADNLGWKLALVMRGAAPLELLDSYDAERVYAARENLLYTESSTQFIAPSSPGALALRDAVLQLAADYPFARPLINSGRLSSPTIMPDSPLNTPDSAVFDTPLIPGAPAADARVCRGDTNGYLLAWLGGVFTCLLYCDDPASLPVAALDALVAQLPAEVPLRVICVSRQPASVHSLPGGIPLLHDSAGMIRQRYDMQQGTVYLLRPDQIICARWRAFDADAVARAVQCACALSDTKGAF